MCGAQVINHVDDHYTAVKSVMKVPIQGVLIASFFYYKWWQWAI